MYTAVIRLQPGNVAAVKQEAACLGFVCERGYLLAGIVPTWGTRRDAVRMVADGRAMIVVVAFGGRDLAGEVIAVGGRVEAVHPTPHVVEPPVPPSPRTVVGLLAQLRIRGKTVEEIAGFLGESTGEIRRILRRGGN